MKQFSHKQSKYCLVAINALFLRVFDVLKPQSFLSRDCPEIRAKVNTSLFILFCTFLAILFEVKTYIILFVIFCQGDIWPWFLSLFLSHLLGRKWKYSISNFYSGYTANNSHTNGFTCIVFSFVGTAYFYVISFHLTRT